MHHTHFSVPLPTILLHPPPCRNLLRLNQPSHPSKSLTWLKSPSWLTRQWICLISAAQWWRVMRRRWSLQSSAFSPHSSIFNTGQGFSYSAFKTTKTDFFLSTTSKRLKYFATSGCLCGQRRSNILNTLVFCFSALPSTSWVALTHSVFALLPNLKVILHPPTLLTPLKRHSSNINLVVSGTLL